METPKGIFVLLDKNVSALSLGHPLSRPRGVGLSQRHDTNLLIAAGNAASRGVRHKVDVSGRAR